jgi:hypothetical protein
MGVPTRDLLEQPRNPIWWAGNLGIGGEYEPGSLRIHHIAMALIL